MNILYITFSDLEVANSGSSLRPMKMYVELKKLADDFYVLSGEQGKKDKKERKESIRRVTEEIKDKKIDLCYIESDTYPIMLRADIRFIKKLIRRGIPIGYFYRDCYRHRKYRYLIRRNTFVGRIKDFCLDVLQYRTDKLLKKIDIVYFPSLTMSAMFDYNVKSILPPAANKLYDVSPRKITQTAIYVGGISKRYGIDLMIEAYNILNESKKEKYRLILVCRENEIERYKSQIKDKEWIETVHASGDELHSLYNEADIGLIPLLGGYNDIGVSVKLFEYLSFGLPVITTDVSEMKRIVEENNLGLVCRQDAQALADTIRAVFEDKERYSTLRESAKQFIRKGNTWADRAMKVCNDLYKR